ncbi:MAG: amino acid adenylation domain-containing protein [Bacteroidales bacterium]
MKGTPDILLALQKSVAEGPDRQAFFIQKEKFTYKEFAQRITAIRKLIRRKVKKGSRHIIGVVAWDHISTYAAIYAIWYEGHVFLPFSPRNPATRNNKILHQTGCRLILSTTDIPGSMLNITGVDVVETMDLVEKKIDLEPVSQRPEDMLYLLFTSGSTGVPKGVVINRNNFNSYIFSFLSLGYELSHEDRFLQLYDFTFDASLRCYVVPLSVGASVYTVPWNEVKYMYALKLMRDHDLTFACMPPSTLAFLKPYFSSIRLEKLRYSLFGGEGLVENLAAEWRECVPNAVIHNVYGPTEVTVNCFDYQFNPLATGKKSYNGIVTIGKPFGGQVALILGTENQQLPAGKKGELCIAGPQVTSGYWKNDERNAHAFITKNVAGKEMRFYRTGDLCFYDKDGDFMFCGRLDNQVQIQGFRVELGEVEAVARSIVKGHVAAVACKNFLGTLQIYLFAEKGNDQDKLLKSLRTKLPDYMIPSGIILLDTFPLNVSGKIDRRAMEELIV